jgi:hypothetical protein
MPPRISPRHEAERHARQLLATIGRELRLARLTTGQSQRQVARLAGTSTSRVSRVERGRVVAVSLPALARHAAAVALQPSVRLYPAGRRPLDAAQLALLGRLRARIHPGCRWELEVPMPIAGDLRAADCRLTVAGVTVVIEAITRLIDVQAQLRAARLKVRDLGASRLVLLVADTRANRETVRAASGALIAALPVAPRRALLSLGAGHDPGGDSLVFL